MTDYEQMYKDQLKTHLDYIESHRLFDAAKAAMQAIISRGHESPTGVARDAVEYANALLRELDHEKGR